MRFVSFTLDFIHPHRPFSFSVLCRVINGYRVSTAQLSADYLGIIQLPLVVLYSAPGPVVVNIHSPITPASSTTQSQRPIVIYEMKTIQNIGETAAAVSKSLTHPRSPYSDKWMERPFALDHTVKSTDQEDG